MHDVSCFHDGRIISCKCNRNLIIIGQRSWRLKKCDFNRRLLYDAVCCDDTNSCRTDSGEAKGFSQRYSKNMVQYNPRMSACCDF